MTKHLRAQSVVVLLLAVLLSACQSIPAVASLAPVAAGPLLTVTTRGGECVDGPCGGTTVIERDGRIHQTVPTAADLGQVPPDVLTALDAAIKTTDFDVVRARPFTGECPVNFDGQEQIFEFNTLAGTQRIASCEVEIDWGHPLFIALAGALGEWIPLPLT